MSLTVTLSSGVSIIVNEEDSPTKVMIKHEAGKKDEAEVVFNRINSYLQEKNAELLTDFNDDIKDLKQKVVVYCFLADLILEEEYKTSNNLKEAESLLDKVKKDAKGFNTLSEAFSSFNKYQKNLEKIRDIAFQLSLKLKTLSKDGRFADLGEPAATKLDKLIVFNRPRRKSSGSINIDKVLKRSLSFDELDSKLDQLLSNGSETFEVNNNININNTNKVIGSNNLKVNETTIEKRAKKHSAFSESEEQFNLDKSDKDKSSVEDSSETSKYVTAPTSSQPSSNDFGSDSAWSMLSLNEANVMQNNNNSADVSAQTDQITRIHSTDSMALSNQSAETIIIHRETLNRFPNEEVTPSQNNNNLNRISDPTDEIVRQDTTDSMLSSNQSTETIIGHPYASIGSTQASSDEKQNSHYPADTFKQTDERKKRATPTENLSEDESESCGNVFGESESMEQKYESSILSFPPNETIVQNEQPVPTLMNAEAKAVELLDKHLKELEAGRFTVENTTFYSIKIDQFKKFKSENERKQKFEKLLDVGQISAYNILNSWKEQSSVEKSNPVGRSIRPATEVLDEIQNVYETAATYKENKHKKTRLNFYNTHTNLASYYEMFDLLKEIQKPYLDSMDKNIHYGFFDRLVKGGHKIKVTKKSDNAEVKTQKIWITKTALAIHELVDKATYFDITPEEAISKIKSIIDKAVEHCPRNRAVSTQTLYIQTQSLINNYLSNRTSNLSENENLNNNNINNEASSALTY